MTEATATRLRELPGRAWIVYASIEKAHERGRRFAKLADLADDAGVSTATAKRAVRDLARGAFIRYPRGWPHRAEPISDQHAPTPRPRKRPAVRGYGAGADLARAQRGAA